MRTRDRVTSACQRWWLWTTVTGDVVTQGQSSQGRRGAGVHGSTPYRRLATSAVSVALAKAAQAGFPRRGRPRPRKPGSSFGRWAPYLQIPPRQGPLHSLKGMVPESAVHVPFVVCGRCVGGSAAQRRSSTPSSAGMRRWQLACDYAMLATELASDFDSLCSSWQLACDFSSRYALLLDRVTSAVKDGGCGRRLPATCPLTRIRQEAAWRGCAREHPIRVVQNGRGMRRPRKTGAGRVSPSREAAPAHAWEQLWALVALGRTWSQITSYAQSQRYCA